MLIQVVGISSMKALTADGVSFAIPIDTAKHIVSQVGVPATKCSTALCLIYLLFPQQKKLPLQADSPFQAIQAVVRAR